MRTTLHDLWVAQPYPHTHGRDRPATFRDLLDALVDAGVLVAAADFESTEGVRPYVRKWVQVIHE